MKNLAGVETCDEYIRVELEKAGLTILNKREPKNSEVPYVLYGVAGGKPLDDDTLGVMERHGLEEGTAKAFYSFVFTRAWYYWIVSGFVPLDIADKIYQNPNGRYDVRAGGHCGAVNPCEVKHQAKICGMNVVDHYHIDTQEGLNFFVETLRQYKLI